MGSSTAMTSNVTSVFGYKVTGFVAKGVSPNGSIIMFNSQAFGGNLTPSIIFKM